ncbi:MarR family transcriptional regulator [Microtetraspora sp. AC03309]|uniref:MarR family winged helix-turn-helix transcriptional regulator n=1 Tax=Microtetraspora sp. AC03309 TaxID=2779376 RepID=UPI001E476509|nr:MarR family transcriptional regulator [Microtetraspora sp. AC03309]MCC5577641.1 MarR family transcriptional regulator [Microtetraspora sp. AC03309]
MEEELEPRWLDGDEQQSWYALALLLNQLPAALDAQMQRDAGIGQFEYMVLSALSMAPERTMRMSVLAEYAGATLSRLSNVVSRLEKRGWVERSPDPSSRRTTLATLTGDGFAVVEQAAPRHVAEVRRLVLDPLTKAQQRQLGVVASRILRAVDPDRGISENS